MSLTHPHSSCDGADLNKMSLPDVFNFNLFYDDSVFVYERFRDDSLLPSVSAEDFVLIHSTMKIKVEQLNQAKIEPGMVHASTVSENFLCITWP